MLPQRKLTALILVFMFTTALCNAAVIPGRWQKLDSQPPGTAIVVWLKTGDRIDATLKGTTTDELVIVDTAGTELRIAKQHVRKIAAAARGDDSRVDGTILGSLVGFGALAGTVAGFYATASESADPPAFHTFFLPASAIGAGGGALVGYLIDRKKKGQIVLYMATP